jgi:hypothetical protein
MGYSLFGYSRSGFGVDATTTTRYVYFGVLFCAPAIAAGVATLALRMRGHPWVVPVSSLMLMGLVVSLGLAQLARFADSRGAMVETHLAQMAAAREFAASGERSLSSIPDRGRSPSLMIRDLQSGRIAATLPHAEPTAQAGLDARANLQVMVGPRTLDLPTFESVEFTGFSGIADGERPLTECVDAVAEVGAELQFPAAVPGGEATLRIADWPLRTQLVADGRESAPVTWSVAPGGEVHLGTVAPDAALRVLVPPGPVMICPV